MVRRRAQERGVSPSSRRLSCCAPCLLLRAVHAQPAAYAAAAARAAPRSPPNRGEEERVARRAGDTATRAGVPRPAPVIVVWMRRLWRVET